MGLFRRDQPARVTYDLYDAITCRVYRDGTPAQQSEFELMEFDARHELIAGELSRTEYVRQVINLGHTIMNPPQGNENTNNVIEMQNHVSPPMPGSTPRL